MLNDKNFKKIIEQYTSGSAQPQLPVKDLKKISVIVPDQPQLTTEFEKIVRSIIAYKNIITEENRKLTSLSYLILSRISIKG